MLSKAQPCFQLLRIGYSSSASSAVSESARDLYTFRPALTRSVFRLGRKPEVCDVTLQSTSISRVHAELHTEKKEGEGEEAWRVCIKDCSSHGTWVNDLRLQPGVQWELSDGDTLTFGSQSDSGSPEFYFLFQKVLVRPSEFDAITLPKAASFSSDLQNRIRTSLEPKTEPNLDLSTLSINRATVILNSIGSISKMSGTCWTFKRSDNKVQPNPSSSSLPPLVSPMTPPSVSSTSTIASSMSVPPSSKSRRKSAHTVLLEDDSSDETILSGTTGDGRRPVATKRRRLCKSESEVTRPLPRVEQHVNNQLLFKPDLNQNGCHHGLQSKARPNQFFPISGQRQEFNLNLKTDSQANLAPKGARGRRRVNSFPICSPLVVGRQNYTLTSPSLRFCEVDRRENGNSGKRRGRPRKHPLTPQPTLLSPSLLSPLGGERVRGEEACASGHCRMPQQETVQWIQCDDCDAWYHMDCVECDPQSCMLDISADFHCGCR